MIKIHQTVILLNVLTKKALFSVLIYLKMYFIPVIKAEFSASLLQYSY